VAKVMILSERCMAPELTVHRDILGHHLGIYTIHVATLGISVVQVQRRLALVPNTPEVVGCQSKSVIRCCGVRTLVVEPVSL
jgi:hypothetical protein